MIETLYEWGERLKKLGFTAEYFQSVCGDLQSIDWFNEDKELISTEVCYTPEYCKYLESLEPGTEYEPDWKQCNVVNVTIHTPEFAYPEGCWLDGKWHGDISLSEKGHFKNFTSLSVENFEKALWMSRHPIQAKNQIARQFMDEVDTFFKLHGETLESLGYKQYESTFLPVGCEITATEPCIVFKRDNQYRKLFLTYNMWTEKLTYTKYVASEGIYGTDYQVNVNETSKKDFIEFVQSLEL